MSQAIWTAAGIIVASFLTLIGVLATAEYTRRSKKRTDDSAQVAKNTEGLAALETVKLQDARLNVQDLQKEIVQLRDRLDISDRERRKEVVDNAQNLIKVNTELAEVRSTVKLQALQIDLLNERLINVTRERDEGRIQAAKERDMATKEREEFQRLLGEAQRRIGDLESEVARLTRHDKISSTA